MELIYPNESYAILGACYEVYKNKGCGFLEGVYQECLEIEFSLRSIPYQSQSPVRLTYKGACLNHLYIPDFLCYEKIVLEIKAHKQLGDEHRAQLLNYLKATDLKLGILVNFGHYPKIEYQRMVS